MPSSSSSKDKEKSSSSSRVKDKPSKPSKPLTASQLRAKESQEYTISLLTSHASYLSPIILSLSSSLSLPAAQVGIFLGGIFLLLHLFAPVFLLPHLSAEITLVIPIRNTLRNTAKEGQRGPPDSAQWSWFWVVYGVLGLVQGGVAIWRPGWKAWFEVIRTAGLICVGGPWFGHAGLNPPGPSEELKKVEKVEQAEEKAKKEKAAKEKEKAEKKAKERKEKEKKEREKQAKAKAKAKSK